MALGRMLGARLLQVVIVLFAISLLTFLLLSLLPGSAAEYRIGPLPDFSPQQRAEIVARLTKQLGLNRALPIQYGIWLWHALKGDLGLTTEGEPVTQLLGSRLGATIELAIAGLIPSIIASLLLATWSFRTRWRRGQGTLQAVMSTFFVLPSFWLAFLLVLAFSVKIPVLPAVRVYPVQSITGRKHATSCSACGDARRAAHRSLLSVLPGRVGGSSDGRFRRSRALERDLGTSCGISSHSAKWGAACHHYCGDRHSLFAEFLGRYRERLFVARARIPARPGGDGA